jgi:acetyl/propionyl-CoA carboxylase alpha subunit
VISTLLVANRGEIAVRIITTARALGLRTVAVYSDADREAPHVRLADTAVRIGPTPASESYLNIEALLDAAARTGADAVHPGYGFLSERAAFARAVTEAGLTFVGPSAEVIEKMGRKDIARDIAVAAGVPVVPSVELTSDGSAADVAPDESVGYPLLIKAAAGGGGKGMRIVRAPAEFADALAAARREAASAFGDDTILVEKYVERGRHVEVQVLADHHGHVVHLFERDCSTQRRHQKVLEEAPAPTISDEVRTILTESAVALAREVGYTNAGTVEFLVEEPDRGVPGAEPDRGVPGAKPPGVFFLEMNTRLQVEHPVTELAVRVAGEPLDLVALQLAVAAGRPLPFTQDQVELSGHAIEARVYAEDAFAGFLPQAGVAELVRWSPRARNDVALESGSEVSTSYDPMLGKVIVHGASREAARRSLVSALDDTAILGLTTNLGFLRGLAASEEFRDCTIDTAWLDRNPDAIRPPSPELPAVLAAWALASPATAGDSSAFALADGWRLAGPPAPTPVELVVDGTQQVYAVDRAGRTVTRQGEQPATWRVHPIAAEAGVLRLEVDDLVHEAAVRITPHRVDVAHLGVTHRLERPDPFGPGAHTGVSDGSVPAPMPGTVLAVNAEEGQQVAAGDVLGVLEAMKMELSLTAPVAGTVTSVGASAGDQVALGAVLFEVTAADDAD